MDGLKIKVKLVDKEEQIFSLRPRIIVEFEQKFGKGMGKLLTDEQKLEHIYYLGWSALKHNGIVVKPFGNDFLDQLESVELTTDPSSESTETV
jgi:hypothetical protein